MNNAVSYAIDSQVIFQTFFSIVCIAAAIGVSILVLRFMRKFIDFLLEQAGIKWSIEESRFGR